MTYTVHTLTSADGTALHATWWLPEGPPKGIVCRVHGLGEHQGRNEHIAQRLVDAGYAVAMVDLRGHGRSQGTRGHTPLKGALEDIDALVAFAQGNGGGEPLFLYGHSLGGLFCLEYVMRRKPDFAGLVVSSPALRSPIMEQTIKVQLAKRLGSLLPWATLPSGLDDAGLSRDRAVIEAYRADPYVHDQVSFRLAKDTLEAAEWVMKHPDELQLPLLLVHGSADPITYPSGTEAFAEKVHGDVTLTIYEGLLHEAHNEPEQQQVLDDIVAWLDDHLPA